VHIFRDPTKYVTLTSEAEVSSSNALPAHLNFMNSLAQEGGDICCAQEEEQKNSFYVDKRERRNKHALFMLFI
jgi:hypothetical protein